MSNIHHHDDDDSDLRGEPPILPIPDEDIAESLGHRDGDRLEIYWEVNEGAHRTVFHWWGCELLPSSASSKQRRKDEHKAARIIKYDPYPNGGFHRHEKDKVIFLNGRWLKDVNSGRQLLYRTVYDNEETVIQSLREQQSERRLRESSKKRKNERESGSSKKHQRSQASSSAQADSTNAENKEREQDEENIVETYLSMSPENWWKVDLKDTVPRNATRLITRCMRKFGYDIAHGKRVLTAYEQFLATVTDRQDWRVVQTVPCKEVEQIWHQHILDTINYRKDCLLLCGHEVHHDPDRPRPTPEMFEVTKAALRQIYQREFDDVIWKEGYADIRKSAESEFHNSHSEKRKSPPMGSVDRAVQESESPSGAVQSPSTPSRMPRPPIGASPTGTNSSAMGELPRDAQHLEPGKIYVQVIFAGNSTFYVFRMTKPLKKVLEIAARSQGLTMESATFVQRNGQVLTGEETARDLSDYAEGSPNVVIEGIVNKGDE